MNLRVTIFLGGTKTKVTNDEATISSPLVGATKGRVRADFTVLFAYSFLSLMKLINDTEIKFLLK